MPPHPPPRDLKLCPPPCSDVFRGPWFHGLNINGCFESRLRGDVAQEVRAVVWQSEGYQFDPTLSVSKCPWARHLTPKCSWPVGCYLAWQPIGVGVWMCVWMGERGINCTALWIKVLYKCSPFTIYQTHLSLLMVYYNRRSRMNLNVYRQAMQGIPLTTSAGTSSCSK